MIDPVWASAAELGDAYRSGAASPVAVVQALLARIEKLEPGLNAFIRRETDTALLSAVESEARWKQGKPLSAIDGVPYGLKDVIDAAGQPTTCHSKLRLNHIAAHDARVTGLLRQAGAVLMGKLATHEFALGGPSFDLPFPPARNPWNRDYHPGGSSSGAGVAVAAGMLPFALGTDTAGSIRNPAGACGVVGLKPTYGLLPRDGVFPLAPSLDHVGPLCRSVADAALLLDLLSEGRPGRRLDGNSYRMDIDSGLAGIRIGVVQAFIDLCESQVAKALQHAIAVLRDAGAVIAPVDLPDLAFLQTVNRVILQAEGWSIHAGDLRQRAGDYAASTRKRLLPGAFLSAEDLLQAQRQRRRMIAAMQQALSGVDILLVPNSFDPICRIDDEVALQHGYARQARAPFNLTGHPAIALPIGFCDQGLPISVQLAGRYFDEALLLRAARGLEQIVSWREARPNL